MSDIVELDPKRNEILRRGNRTAIIVTWLAEVCAEGRMPTPVAQAFEEHVAGGPDTWMY